MIRIVVLLLVLLLLLFDFRHTQAKISTYAQQMAILQSTLPLPGYDSTVCRTIPSLSKSQMALCYRQPDVTVVALQGLQEALQECQHQFHGHRWNCSNLAAKKNIYSSSLLQKGYRETAFAFAISAAGATIAVARACSQGRLISCGCDNRNYRARIALAEPWKWGGCSHNLKFGAQFTRSLLDHRDNAVDLQSRVNAHNNQVGRLAVANNMQVQCKCHGMSGSCQIKTCWRSAPDIRQVGRILKERFRTAVLVDQNNAGSEKEKSFKIVKTSSRKKHHIKSKRKNNNNNRKNNNNNSNNKKKEWLVRNNNNNNNIPKERSKKALSHDLLYYQQSPNFCEVDAELDVTGTTGRECNRTSTGQDNCSSLCCGRGYNQVLQRNTERCNCKFIWCCKVECEMCTTEEYKTYCN